MTDFKLCAIGEASILSELPLNSGEGALFASPVHFTFEQFDPEAIDLSDTLFLIIDDLSEADGQNEKAIKAFFKKVKKIKVLKQAPFVLISNQWNPTYCKQAYKAGALDIMSLQQCAANCEARFSAAMNSFAREQKGLEKAKESQQVALDAMQDAAEYGRILNFFNHSSDCHTFESLSEAIMEIYASMDVHGSMAIMREEEIFFYADDGKERPIESQLIRSVRDKYIADLVAQTNPKRILTSGTRIITVGFGCGLLLRDVPEEKVGRMRDIIAGLITGLDARVQYLISQQRAEKRQAILKKILINVNETVVAFQTQFEDSEQKSINVIDDFMLTLNSGLAELCLSEEQEQYFISAADSAMGSLVEQHKDQIILRRQLDSIVEELSMLSKMKKH